MRTATPSLVHKHLRQIPSWLWWLAPQPFDWVATALYLGVFIAFIAAHWLRWTLSWQAVLLTGLLLLLLSMDRLEYWWYGEQTPRRSALLLLATRMLLIESVALIEGFEFSPFLYMIPPYRAMVSFGNAAGYGVAGLVEVVYVAKVSWYQPHWYLQRTNLFLVILFTFGVLFVVTMARVVSQERASRMRAEQLLTEVESSHRQLKAYAERVAELAATEERNRVARDIHDSLGHALMAITVQLEKALVYYERQPHEAVQAISDAKGVAKEALQDVRRSLRVLRTTQDAFSCAEGITHLTQRLRSTHLVIDLHIIGHEEGFSRQALMTLYRVAQEGLTNIQKHSHASAVQVEVCFGQQEARLSIRDNGDGFDPRFVRQEPGDGEEGEGGYGLQGIRERLDLIGGSLHLESSPGRGTHLVITVPKVSVSVWQKETSEG